MRITLVKKIKSDGSPCRKCIDVLKRLEDADQMKYIDEVLIADENDDNSPGMQLAQELEVERAPFFVVEEPNKAPVVYTVYFNFVKEVLNSKTNEADELKEIMEANPDLDYI